MNYYTFRTIQIVLITLTACALMIVVSFIIAGAYRHHKQQEQWLHNQSLIDSIKRTMILDNTEARSGWVVPGDDGPAIQKALDSAAMPANRGKGRWVKIKP